MSGRDHFLDRRTAWVTGGTTGIGRAIAEALASAGARVAITTPPVSMTLGKAAYTTLPGSEAAEEARASIAEIGAVCLLLTMDLRDDDSVAAAHERVVRELGPVDILVNAAGVCAQESMLEADDATWHTLLDINLTGAYRTSKRCMGPMIARRWGRLIHIGSTAASVGFVGHAAYCASKHGLLGLSRCAAMEGTAHGVTSNVISPGSVDTGLTRLGSARRIARGGAGRTVEENMAAVAAATPQHRLIQPSEIASVALFLCREEAKGLTAEDIIVSGGASW